MATREELNALIDAFEAQGLVELYINPDDLPGATQFAGIPLVRSPLVEPGSIYVYNPKGQL